MITSGPILSALLLGLASVPPASASDPHDVERFVPSDSDIIAVANVRQLVGSPLFKKYALERVRHWLKTDPRAQLMALVGMDPTRDVRRLVLARLAGPAIRERWLLVVEGRFELPKIETGAKLTARLSPDTLKIEKEEGLPVYELRNKKRPEPIFAVLIDEKTLIVSPIKNWIHDAVSKALGRKKTELDKELHALVGKRDPDKSLWFAGIPYDLVKNQLVRYPRLEAIFSSVRWFKGVVELNDQARADLEVSTTNARAAQQLRRYFEGAKVVAELAIASNEQFRKDAPLLTGIIRTFEISQENGAVKLEATLTSEQIDQWIKKEQEKSKNTKPPP
jgi:hypothetical protein